MVHPLQSDESHEPPALGLVALGSIPQLLQGGVGASRVDQERSGHHALLATADNNGRGQPSVEPHQQQQQQQQECQL